MICSSCKKEFTPTHKRQRQCKPSCHTDRRAKEIKEERFNLISIATKGYKCIQPIEDAKADVKVILRDVLSVNDRMNLTGRFTNLKKPLDRVEVENGRIKACICSANEVLIAIKYFEEKYLKTGNLQYKSSINGLNRIRYELYNYAKGEQNG